MNQYRTDYLFADPSVGLKTPVGMITNIASAICEPGFQKEKTLTEQWLRLLPGTVLKDSTGNSVTIIDSGGRNVNEGPDCRGAVVYTRGGFLNGDVECHLSANDWFHHGHRSDPRYAKVILHVLARVTPAINNLPAAAIVLTADGVQKPDCTLSVQNLIKDSGTVLEKLARRRWIAFLDYFYSTLANREIFLNVLLRSSYRILGKGGNENNFETLADTIIATGLSKQSETEIESWLRVESRALNWKRCGMRPGHRPDQRLSLAANLFKFIQKWPPGYWHQEKLFDSDFEQVFGHRIGSGILTELLVNVFYPALAAQALDQNGVNTAQRWEQQWLKLKLPYSYGRYTRRFGRVFTASELKRVATLQGLKVLEKEFCRPRFCRLCPMKKRHARVE